MRQERTDPSTFLGDLAGRRAVVTGAAHGIGKAIALRLADAGAEVIVIDQNGSALRSRGDRRWVQVVANMAGPDVVDLADRLLQRHGLVELIVNNVGGASNHRFLQLEREAFDDAVNVNLRGPWFFTRRLVQALIANERGGSVLFISSLHDHLVRLLPHYSVTKAGVAMLVKELANELAPHGIRVNAISPGWVETQDADELPTVDKRIARLIPAGRLGVPDDIAKMALILLSDAWSAYVTGANIPVDGGLRLHNWLMDLDRL
jgi:NAD(P)-dependent dehydrogenase (short-subunit alcohol dehydrogenase family)